MPPSAHSSDMIHSPKSFPYLTCLDISIHEPKEIDARNKLRRMTKSEGDHIEMEMIVRLTCKPLEICVIEQNCQG